jgi:hypothetical protein
MGGGRSDWRKELGRFLKPFLFWIERNHSSADKDDEGTVLYFVGTGPSRRVETGA